MIFEKLTQSCFRVDCYCCNCTAIYCPQHPHNIKTQLVFVIAVQTAQIKNLIEWFFFSQNLAVDQVAVNENKFQHTISKKTQIPRSHRHNITGSTAHQDLI